MDKILFNKLNTKLKTGYYIDGHFIPPQKTEINDVTIDDKNISINLSDGRIVITPLEWFPLLKAASPEQRSKIEFSPIGIHWPELDEDFHLDTFLDQYLGDS